MRKYDISLVWGVEREGGNDGARQRARPYWAGLPRGTVGLAAALWVRRWPGEAAPPGPELAELRDGDRDPDDGDRDRLGIRMLDDAAGAAPAARPVLKDRTLPAVRRGAGAASPPATPALGVGRVPGEGEARGEARDALRERTLAARPPPGVKLSLMPVDVSTLKPAGGAELAPASAAPGPPGAPNAEESGVRRCLRLALLPPLEVLLSSSSELSPLSRVTMRSLGITAPRGVLAAAAAAAAAGRTASPERCCWLAPTPAPNVNGL